MEIITVFVLILFSPPIQDCYHLILLVGFKIWVLQYYVAYLISMNFPYVLDEDVTFHLQPTPTLMYPLL